MAVSPSSTRRAAVILVALAACSHQQLHPTAASLVPGTEAIARAESAGVQVQLDGKAWIGNPDQLPSVVPVQIAIHNGSDCPLQLRYGNFVLTDSAGRQQAAVPPMAVAQKMLAQGTPAYTAGPGPFTSTLAGQGIFVAGPYGPYYNGFPTWSGGLPWDALYFENYYGDWPAALPAAATLYKALPEGVIDAGGRVNGFLYFQEVPSDVQQVTFRAQLVDARNGNLFGSVAIPLMTVKER